MKKGRFMKKKNKEKNSSRVLTKALKEVGPDRMRWRRLKAGARPAYRSFPVFFRCGRTLTSSDRVTTREHRRVGGGAGFGGVGQADISVQRLMSS